MLTVDNLVVPPECRISLTLERQFGKAGRTYYGVEWEGWANIRRAMPKFHLAGSGYVLGAHFHGSSRCAQAVALRLTRIRPLVQPAPQCKESWRDRAQDSDVTTLTSARELNVNSSASPRLDKEQDDRDEWGASDSCLILTFLPFLHNTW